MQWVYIPHLDYDLQRFGPSSPQAKQAVRDAAAVLEPLVTQVLSDGGTLILLSEYSMKEVNAFVRPNRILAKAGLLVTRETEDGMLIDYDRSAAVAMVDHQIAHVYVRDAAMKQRVADALKGDEMASIAPPGEALRHRRAGDLVCSAAPGAWFDYRWWADPAEAPSFAKTIDIHRKPGYDGLELFWDRQTNGVSQNLALLKGSHGVVTNAEGIWIAEGDSHGPVTARQVAQAVTQLLNQAT